MTSFFALISIIILDIITINGIKKAFPQFTARYWRKIRLAFIIQASIAAAIILYGAIFQKRISDYRIIASYFYLFGGIVALYMPKGAYATMLIIERFFTKKKCVVAKYGFWISLIVVPIFVAGVFYGRYNFTVEHVEVNVDNLPKEFNGYKIVQLSDIHAGSFAGTAHRFQKVVDLINAQNPDIVVITGDIVNNFADELTSFIPVFSKINATDGKYAVLGNHDYGGYYKWKKAADSVANLKAIENSIELMGFEILNNQAIKLNRGDTSAIALIGVENWGKLKRFPKRADLDKAMKTVNEVSFKILLTHDPSFWTKEVKGKTDIALTLSGHTHGMQMGVKIGNKRYGPARLFPRFRYWAGLYHIDNQYLYVNRGLGVVGIPARIGMPPEITVIEINTCIEE